MPHPSHTADERVIVFVSGRALEFLRAMAQPFQLGVWNDAQNHVILAANATSLRPVSLQRKRACHCLHTMARGDGAAVTHWSVECER
jgi:hypothetical protein